MFELVKKEYRLIRFWLLLALGIVATVFSLELLNVDEALMSTNKLNFIKYTGKNLLPYVGPTILFFWSFTKDNTKLLLTNRRHMLLQLGLKVIFATISTMIFIMLCNWLFPLAHPQIIKLSTLYEVLFISCFVGIAALMVKLLKPSIGAHSWWITFLSSSLLLYTIITFLDFIGWNYLMDLFDEFNLWALSYPVIYGLIFTASCCIAEKKLEL